ncbi:hypothetical protein LCGC14_2815740 [marine sediment metagenome]|uniref:Uncharacterized protein n=1 Tax=marine sediment metagenome TaxID=412755 RepID=A0A0F8Z5C5_9ZZZZ
MKKILLTILLMLFVAGCEEIYLRNPFSTKPPIVVHVMTPDDYFPIPPGAWVEWDDMMGGFESPIWTEARAFLHPEPEETER